MVVRHDDVGLVGRVQNNQNGFPTFSLKAGLIPPTTTVEERDCVVPENIHIPLPPKEGTFA